MNSAIIAGVLPTPKIGIIKANKANEGTVCKALVKPMTILATLGKRVNQTPTGTAIATPNKSAKNEI